MSCCKGCNPLNSEWTSEQLIQVCRELNEKYFDKYNCETGMNAQHFGWVGFIYESCDYADGIKFNDTLLWDSENDERAYCDDCEYGYHTESIEEYVEKEYHNYVKLLFESIENVKLDEYYSDLPEGKK